MRHLLLTVLLALTIFIISNDFCYGQVNTVHQSLMNQVQAPVVLESLLVSNANLPVADRYYIRVSGCDDGGKAYLNNTLIVDVGFNEDSNWLDITEDVAQGKDKIKFEVINKTGAITYIFQVKKNDQIIFEQSCGRVKEMGCQNNRAFRVGKARKFAYTIGKDRQSVSNVSAQKRSL